MRTFMKYKCEINSCKEKLKFESMIKFANNKDIYLKKNSLKKYSSFLCARCLYS